MYDWISRVNLRFNPYAKLRLQRKYFNECLDQIQEDQARIHLAEKSLRMIEKVVTHGCGGTHMQDCEISCKAEKIRLIASNGLRKMRDPDFNAAKGGAE